MAASVVQVDNTLWLVSSDGQTSQQLTLPTDIDLATDRPPRMTNFGRYVVITNTPSRPITVDGLGKVRVLAPRPPNQALTIDDDGGAGTLTGDYKARQTFLLLDHLGNVIAESDYGPLMETAFTASSDTLNVEDVNLSPDDVQASRIYRTTAGGEVYFTWIDIDGNTQTRSVSDTRTDEEIGDFAAPELGSPPDLTTIASWRGRLWGVDRTAIDHVRFSEAGLMYAWPLANSIPADPVGSDFTGITAFMVRRDQLGVGRLNGARQITGTSNTDFRCINLSENVGALSQESTITFRDTVYFLWFDGVYAWGPEGLKCVSDGRVRKWFTSDDYFERSRFPFAFFAVDPFRNKLRLYLAAAGSSTEDRWIEYDLTDKTWWGPHKTAAFDPRSAWMGYDANNKPLPLTGGTAGFIYKGQTTAADDTSALEIDIITKFHDNDTPDIDKFWGQLCVLGKVQTSGITSVTPKTGYLDAPAQLPIIYTQSRGRQRLRRVGTGKLLQLAFTQASGPLELYGYEINDVHELGQR